jgi:hypothetical protein
MASWEPKHCSCYVLLINYILCNQVVFDYKFIYFIIYQRWLVLSALPGDFLSLSLSLSVYLSLSLHTKKIVSPTSKLIQVRWSSYPYGRDSHCWWRSQKHSHMFFFLNDRYSNHVHLLLPKITQVERFTLVQFTCPAFSLMSFLLKKLCGRDLRFLLRCFWEPRSSGYDTVSLSEWLSRFRRYVLPYDERTLIPRRSVKSRRNWILK